MFDGSFTANEVEELKKDFERKLAKLEHVFGLRLSNLKQEIINELSPQQNGAGLPPIDEITKIEAQMFTNTAKGKPGCQLKLYIWTCPTKLMANHRCGNMNEKYIPLHRVNDRRGHDKLRGIWRQVADFGVDLLERAGKMKGADHVALITPKNRLLILHGNHVLDFGLPKLRQDDQNQRAAIARWYYPAVYRES